MWIVWKKTLALAIRYKNIHNNKHIQRISCRESHSKIHTQANEPLNLTKKKRQIPKLETMKRFKMTSQMLFSLRFIFVFRLTSFRIWEFLLFVAGNTSNNIIYCCDCPGSLVLSTFVPRVVYSMRSNFWTDKQIYSKHSHFDSIFCPSLLLFACFVHDY